MTEDTSPPLGPASPAFEAAYRAEFSYVWHSLRRLGIDDRDLEDLTHDVFMVAHRRFEEYDSSRPIRPWLFGIALRLVSHFRARAHHAREVFTDAPHVHDESAAPDEVASARQQRSILFAALAGLSPEKQSVFVMHDLNGHNMPEVAQALAIPLNTAYSRLRLARADLVDAIVRLRA